jgi:hypothetical protein
LALDDELMVRKGEAKAVGPAAAAPLPRVELPPEVPPAVAAPPARTPDAYSVRQQDAHDDLPLVIGKRQTVERVFTNVRIPVDLDERLFRMMVATRRKKQDIIENFIREGLERYENELRRAGGRARVTGNAGGARSGH